MKPNWGWMLAIVVVCLLWSLTAEASMNPASSFEKHLLARSRDSWSPASCPSLPVLREDCIRSRAGPQEFFFSPDVLLCAEDLDPKGPPSLESRGPPGKYRDPGRPGGLSVAKVATGTLIKRGKLLRSPEFYARRPAQNENRVFQQTLAKHSDISNCACC